MADIKIKARAFWTDIENGTTAVGFAASENPDDGYVLFEGIPGATIKTIYVEISDEIFGADNAIETVVFSDAGFTLTLTPRAARRFGMVREVEVHVAANDTDGQSTIAALKILLGRHNGF
jgi:hypothetical protein